MRALIGDWLGVFLVPLWMLVGYRLCAWDTAPRVRRQTAKLMSMVRELAHDEVAAQRATRKRGAW